MFMWCVRREQQIYFLVFNVTIGCTSLEDTTGLKPFLIISKFDGQLPDEFVTQIHLPIAHKTGKPTFTAP